jgi:hypothetical protein
MYKITYWAPIEVEIQFLQYKDEFKYFNIDEDFVDYIDEDSELSAALISGHAHFDLVADKPHIFTVYNSNRFLTFKELLELSDYTQGQWSDGIGEGYEQEPQYSDDDTEIFISMWYPNQPIFYKQEFIGHDDE